MWLWWIIYESKFQFDKFRIMNDFKKFYGTQLSIFNRFDFSELFLHDCMNGKKFEDLRRTVSGTNFSEYRFWKWRTQARKEKSYLRFIIQTIFQKKRTYRKIFSQMVRWICMKYFLSSVISTFFSKFLWMMWRFVFPSLCRFSVRNRS